MFIVKGVHIEKATKKAREMLVAEYKKKGVDINQKDLDKLAMKKLRVAADKVRPSILSGEFDIPSTAESYAKQLKASGEYFALSIHAKVWRETNGVKDITPAGRPKKSIEHYSTLV